MYNHNRDKSHFEHKIREIELLAEQIAAKHILYGTSNLFFEIQQLVGNLKREIESHCLTYSGGHISLMNRYGTSMNRMSCLLLTERRYT